MVMIYVLCSTLREHDMTWHDMITNKAVYYIENISGKSSLKCNILSLYRTALSVYHGKQIHWTISVYNIGNQVTAAHTELLFIFVLKNRWWWFRFCAVLNENMTWHDMITNKAVYYIKNNSGKSSLKCNILNVYRTVSSVHHGKQIHWTISVYNIQNQVTAAHTELFFIFVLKTHGDYLRFVQYLNENMIWHDYQ